MSEQDKPKSVRMNKGHRDDILNSVMEQWSKNNPMPDPGFAEFITAIFKRYAQAKKSRATEYNSLARLLETHRAIVDAIKPLTHQQRVRMNPNGTSQLSYQVQTPEGERRSSDSFVLPAALADKLGIPYLKTCRSSGKLGGYMPPEILAWPEYVESSPEEEFLDVITLYGANYNHTFAIEADIPEVRKLYKAERARNLWNNEKQKMRGEVNDYLSQFNTTGQIRDLWPEMEQYLPAHIADPGRVINLPTLTKSRLNERLGL